VTANSVIVSHSSRDLFNTFKHSLLLLPLHCSPDSGIWLIELKTHTLIAKRFDIFHITLTTAPAINSNATLQLALWNHVWSLTRGIISITINHERQWLYPGIVAS